ncbi:hypothetical protein ANN_12038 [Periplaneta americana]|uniref:RNase H type-1 domain-containing protein n=1 Tax=Periplaneta americana TaxID=6978 RepID=A0ABQ8T8L6_PERAM|nr:hypothetical protein ANN_12038 [Periplaneta americana]
MQQDNEHPAPLVLKDLPAGRIFGPVRDGETWKIRCNNELYQLYESPDIITSIKIARLRWAGHVKRMDECEIPRKVMEYGIAGGRRVGRPKLRWMDCVMDDIKWLGVKNWGWQYGTSRHNEVNSKDGYVIVNLGSVLLGDTFRDPDNVAAFLLLQLQCQRESAEELCGLAVISADRERGRRVVLLCAFRLNDLGSHGGLGGRVLMCPPLMTARRPGGFLDINEIGYILDGEAAGVTCCLFSLYRSLGYGTTSFDGEIIAISESLRNLLCHINKFKNAVILSDSKAAILSIVSKHTPSSQTAEITKMLSQLISLNKRIIFQWIPSHCGILGNENADALVKKGSTATYRPVTKSTYYSVKRFIKSTYLDFNKQNLITQSQGKKWNSLHQNPQLIPDLPRKSSVAAFRLATGHDCLAKHLHRIGIYQSPICPLCNSNQEMDSNTSKSVLQWLVMIISLKNIGVQEVK